MLIIQELTIEAIGRFVEPQTVRFDPLGNLIQVDGLNNNTGGSSGGGKSTLFKALEYLLGLNDIPVSILQSRLTKSPIKVSGQFLWNNEPLTITRGKKGLSIETNGEVIEGSSKLSEEYLDKILGLPRDLFRKLLHKRQGEGGFFLDLKPKEMNEFLSDAMALSQEYEKIAKIDLKISELTKSKDAEILKTHVLQSSIDALKSFNFTPPKHEFSRESLVELKKKATESEEKLTSTLSRHASDTNTLKQSAPVPIPLPVLEKAEELPSPSLLPVPSVDSSEIAPLEAQILGIKSTIDSLKSQDTARILSIKDYISHKQAEVLEAKRAILAGDAAKSQATALGLEVKKIRSSICPTCDQSWVHESSKAKEVSLMDSINELIKTVKLGEKAKTSIISLENELELLKNQLQPAFLQEIAEENSKIAQINDQIAKIKAEYSEKCKEINQKNKELIEKHRIAQSALSEVVRERNSKAISEVQAQNAQAQSEYSQKLSLLQAKQSEELTPLRGQVEIDKTNLQYAVMKFKSTEEAIKSYEHNSKAAQEQLASTESDLKNAQATIVKFEEELLLAEELKKAVKLFISMSFDDALEAIGDAATKILRCIPTMSSATIQLEPQKETKEGRVKEEVNASIHMDGEIGIPIKSLSGGERSAVDLSIDLAVVDFIESKASMGCNLFILDEPFTGLDTVGIEMALEVLKNNNLNKKLIIVDHNPEVKQMVSDKITVIRDGLISRIG